MGGGLNYNSMTLLHTTGESLAVAAQVKKITSKTASIVLLHDDNNGTQLKGDASLQSIHEKGETGYKIIYKDNIRVGVITAASGEQNTVSRINQLSAYLKKEKDCSLVVCVSALGYKNKNADDDLTLAAESENLDIIVGKYKAGSPKRPVIARSKKKTEVIIQHTEDSSDALGKIRIGFDQQGRKYHASF